MYVSMCTYVHIRDATILQYNYLYIAIFTTAIQYNTPDKNIDILLIAIIIL